MTASLVAVAGYLLTLVCYSFAFLLFLEWLFHLLPWAGLNPLRRVLFRGLFPLVSFGENYLSLEREGVRSRGILVGVLMAVLGKYGAPWLILASYGLRG